MLTARQLSHDDFDRFDYLIAMDNGHLRAMQTMAPASAQDKLHLFLNVLPDYVGQDVPDPYYGGQDDFTQVFDLVSQGCEALMQSLTKQRPA